MIHLMKGGRAACGVAVTSGAKNPARVTCPECREIEQKATAAVIKRLS